MYHKNTENTFIHLHCSVCFCGTVKALMSSLHPVLQVQNLHSCVQVINDFVSPEHVAKSFHLTQELRPTKEEVNYEDKLSLVSRRKHLMQRNQIGSLVRDGNQ